VVADVVTNISVEADIQRYTLSGDDIYIKRYTTATVPAWYKALISDIVSTDTTITDIQGAIDFLTVQGTGFNQSIVNLDSADSALNASLTTLTSQVGANTAGIGTLNVSKVDATQATAISETVVASAFGAGGISDAWFSSKVSTYASAIDANASNIQTLSATLDGQTVRIDSVETVAIDAASWSASASKLITAPDGSITGWSFADGSNTNSTFKVYADNFIIQGASTTIDYNNANLVPSITARTLPSEVANAINTNTTTINGSKITTGTVTADKLIASSLSLYSGGGAIGLGTENTILRLVKTSNTGAPCLYITDNSTQYYPLTIERTSTSSISELANFVSLGSSGSYGVNIQSNGNTSLNVSGGWNTNAAGYFSNSNGGKSINLATPSYAYLTGGGASGTFTGAHDSFVPNTTVLEQGDIVVTTTLASKKNFYDTSPIVDISSTAMDKRVYGIYAQKIDDYHAYPSLLNPDGTIDLIYMELLSTHYGIVTNALGEGQINVCGMNGNINIGDYICTSTIPGKGMKQNDDILHNYTVAKATEDVVFDYPEQVKMIACTYHCS